MSQGMFANDWRVSSRCASGTCLAASFAKPGIVMIKDTKAADSPILEFPASSWAAFTLGLRNGDFQPR